MQLTTLLMANNTYLNGVTSLYFVILTPHSSEDCVHTQSSERWGLGGVVRSLSHRCSQFHALCWKSVLPKLRVRISQRASKITLREAGESQNVYLLLLWSIRNLCFMWINASYATSYYYNSIPHGDVLLFVHQYSTGPCRTHISLYLFIKINEIAALSHFNNF